MEQTINKMNKTQISPTLYKVVSAKEKNKCAGNKVTNY